MHNKSMGLYGNLTKKRAKKEKKILQLGVAPWTTHLQSHLFFFFVMSPNVKCVVPENIHTPPMDG